MGLNVNDMLATVGEVQRDYLYFIQFIPNTGSGSTDVGTMLTKLYNEALTKLNTHGLQLDMYNMKAIIPNRKTNEIALPYAGQTVYFSGTDGSQKTNTLEFLQDENGVVYDFFDTLQQLTGDEKTHASAYRWMQEIGIGIAQVSVTKKTITLYKKLNGAKIMGVDASAPSKEGNGISRITASICWNSSETIREYRGKEF